MVDPNKADTSGGQKMPSDQLTQLPQGAELEEGIRLPNASLAAPATPEPSEPLAESAGFSTPAAAGQTPEPAIAADQRLELTESLLEENHAVVYRYAHRLCGCNAASEDITQEVFLRAFKNIHQLKDAAASRGWLLAITRNEFSRWCKKQKALKSLDVESAEEPIAAPLPDSALEQNEWLGRAMAKLPEDYRVVVAMYYFEELTYASIAAQLEIPMGTVMSRLSRAKKCLREELDRQ